MPNAIVALTLSSILIVAAGSAYVATHVAASVSCPRDHDNAATQRFFNPPPLPTNQPGVQFKW
jgi:hypothetical protein